MKYGRIELTCIHPENLVPRTKYYICHKNKRAFLHSCICRFTHRTSTRDVFDDLCFYKIFDAYEMNSNLNLSLYHFTADKCDFYEINPQKNKIQLQMEQRAILLILRKITGDQCMYYNLEKN